MNSERAIQVTWVPWNTHAAALQRIREIVFIIEQGVPREEEWDDQDELAEHFIAIDTNGNALGCARLLPSGQIGRMAVLSQHRGLGIGRALLRAAMTGARARGMRAVFLHAQTHALEFYRKSGFVEHGPEFMEAGIPHREMTRDLSIA
ncbi:MAG: GNAT family N-acetyltransferase [Pseudomonadales bacterium]